jgi:hypothetical protein
MKSPEDRLICYGFVTLIQSQEVNDLLNLGFVHINGVKLVLKSCEDYQNQCQPLFAKKA